ncbi:hypothetical protein KCG44_09425 [Pacificimonas sp. WHA3]|uniref:Flagellar motor switch protein FliG n=1 Tax=Pacificimonas pallii TaxID=2827236 RepID=A0ABS6SF33_9SPHN|nr:FliG C-terminal domain-containing protein [Pacificimonas pallii]MBV7257002.1 hypothetical protein [Pacificimonas pallii]
MADSSSMDGMTPVQQAAVLLMLLDEEQSSAFIGGLEPAQAEALGTAMVQIAEVDQTATSSVIANFLDNVGEAAPVSGGASAARTMFSRALGDARAAQMLGAAMPSSTPPDAPELQWIARAQLAELLTQEHPQAIAAALSLVPANVASDILPHLDADVQTDCLMRLARMDELSSAAVALIREAYSGGVLPVGFSIPINQISGIDVTVDILKMLPPAQAKALQERMMESDKELAETIDERMLIFEDLLTIDGRAMQQVIAAVPQDLLASALRGAGDDLKAHILKGMSTRAAQTLEDTMKSAKPASRDDVERARSEIMRTVRQLADKGDIMIGGGDDLV